MSKPANQWSVYIRKRKSGWHAISRKTSNNIEETTSIGPMSREDAVLVRGSMRKAVAEESEVQRG